MAQREGMTGTEIIATWGEARLVKTFGEGKWEWALVGGSGQDRDEARAWIGEYFHGVKVDGLNENPGKRRREKASQMNPSHV